jgi:hypothetical protein
MEEDVERARVEFAAPEMPGVKRAVDQEEDKADENAEQDFILTKADMIGSDST